MGNRCAVCFKTDRQVVKIKVYNTYSMYVYCHPDCISTRCECGEEYSEKNWRDWNFVYNYGDITHRCIKYKCCVCDYPMYLDKHIISSNKRWHTRCNPSNKNWPICNGTNIALRFRAFPREYRKYMLFQYWTLRHFILDKNIVWKIVTLAVYPYGYATHIQNDIPIDDIHPSCKCGELKQYLTNYTPRCINGCVNYNIDQICEILNIPTNITRDQKLTLIKKILFLCFDKKMKNLWLV